MTAFLHKSFFFC